MQASQASREADTPTLHACPLSRLDRTLAALGASRVVTLHSPGAGMPRPAGIAPGDHLVLELSDLATAREGQILEGHVLASEAQVARLIAFVRAWPRVRPLVVHCYAGVSRSTAAVYVAACALRPGADEAALARALRRASPSATPNPRLVALGDALLGRQGRMVAGIAAMGRGAEAFEGEPFAMPLDPATVAEMHACQG